LSDRLGSLCGLLAGAPILAARLPLAVFALPIVAGTVLALTIIALAIVAGAVLTQPLLALASRIDRLVEIGEIALHRKFAGILALVAEALAAVRPTLVTAHACLFLPLAGVGDHAKIVIGKLEEIFRLNAITVKVRVVRQLAILFQHLRGIAAGPAVDPVDRLTIALRPAVAPATPTVVVIVVVIAMVVQGCEFPSPGRASLCRAALPIIAGQPL
jgi:hypothetical protein